MTATILEATAPRVLPALTTVNRAYWTGGATGQLLVLRCAGCRRWIHPPTDQCPRCGGELVPEPVSGQGVVFTFTVNAHQFHPEVPPPNTIAIVELVEQADLRLATSLVNCSPDDVNIGLTVQVAFERHGEIYVPVFEPLRESA